MLTCVKEKVEPPVFFFLLLLLFNPHQRTFFHCFLEREGGGERNIDVREKHRLVASHTHSDQD